MIPLIEYACLEAEEPEALEQLLRANRDVGVFYLDGGALLSPAFLAAVFEQAQRFFDLPLEKKQALKLSNSLNFRGYVGMREEFTNGIPDLKESFEFAKERIAPVLEDPPAFYQLYGLNQWPDATWLPGFQPTLTRFQEIMEQMGRGVLRGLARTLGLVPKLGSGSGYFEGESCHFSRLINYSAPPSFDRQSVRLSEHTDHALFTIGLQDAHGLEVKTLQEEWMLATPPAGACVVFLGELTEFWTRGYYRACVHRVHNAALRQRRLSMTTFFLPDLHSVVEPLDPASNRALAEADLSLSSDNSWLAPGTGGPPEPGRSAGRSEQRLLPIIVGEKEWERVTCIFPDEKPAA